MPMRSIRRARQSFAPNANNNIAASCAGPLGSGEPDHSNPINDSAASAPIFTGGCCATCANVADCMSGDPDGDGDGFILIAGGNSGAGGAGAGTGVGGDTSLVGGGSASAGLVINVFYDASVANAPAAFKTDVAAAVQFFQSHFSDPVTININVGYGEVAGHNNGRRRAWSKLLLCGILHLCSGQKCAHRRRKICK